MMTYPTNVMHKDCRPTDRYEVIIDGQWYRYTEVLEEAMMYGKLNGNAVVFDINSGKTVARWA